MSLGLAQIKKEGAPVHDDYQYTTTTTTGTGSALEILRGLGVGSTGGHWHGSGVAGPGKYDYYPGVYKPIPMAEPMPTISVPLIKQLPSDAQLQALKGGLLMALMSGKSDEEIAKEYASHFKGLKEQLEQDYHIKRPT